MTDDNFLNADRGKCISDVIDNVADIASLFIVILVL